MPAKRKVMVKLAARQAAFDQLKDSRGRKRPGSQNRKKQQ